MQNPLSSIERVRLVLSGGLPPKTPPANIHALIETAARYGQYNPDGTLHASGWS